MRAIVSFLIVIVSLLAACTSAFAHRPYFTQGEKIRLSSGEMGEVRLLNGDGILGPDPVRAIILSSEGRLLARSRKSLSMALACEADGQCLIFDYSAGKILDPNPTAFRQGPTVPGLSDHERNSLWDLEDGLEDWGFMPRGPDLGERLLGYRMILERSSGLFISNAVVGAVCALLALSILVIIRKVRRRLFEMFIAALAILLITGMGLFLIVASGFFNLLGGLTFGLWLASLSLGGLSIGVWGLIRRRSLVRGAADRLLNR